MPFKDRLKAVVGAVLALGTGVAAVWSDHVIDQAEITVLVGLVGALITALGVYHAKNG